MSSAKIIVLCEASREASLASHLIAGLAARGLHIEVQRVEEGETIVLEDGVDYLVCEPKVPDVQKEIQKLSLLKSTDFDCVCELSKPNGHHAGTAFYDDLPKYRRRDKRRARKW